MSSLAEETIDPVSLLVNSHLPYEVMAPDVVRVGFINLNIKSPFSIFTGSTTVIAIGPLPCW